MGSDQWRDWFVKLKLIPNQSKLIINLKNIHIAYLYLLSISFHFSLINELFNSHCEISYNYMVTTWDKSRKLKIKRNSVLHIAIFIKKLNNIIILMTQYCTITNKINN